LAERQVAELVDDDEVVTQQLLGQPTAATGGFFLFELIDQIDQVEEAPPGAGADYGRGYGDAQMSFAGTGRSSDILPGIRTTAGGFITPFIRDVVKRCLSFVVSVSKAGMCLSFINSMER
jgi:hypothetical protein